MTAKAELIARHVSPDGQLVFRIEREEGAVSFGFEGLPWHLHPDQIASDETDPVQVAKSFTTDLIEDRYLIVINKFHERTAYRIAFSLEVEIDSKPSEQGLAFRFWSRGAVSVDDLIEEKAVFTPLSESLR